MVCYESMYRAWPFGARVDEIVDEALPYPANWPPMLPASTRVKRLEKRKKLAEQIRELLLEHR